MRDHGGINASQKDNLTIPVIRSPKGSRASVISNDRPKNAMAIHENNAKDEDVDDEFIAGDNEDEKYSSNKDDDYEDEVLE